jgi:hypothetical protein
MDRSYLGAYLAGQYAPLIVAASLTAVDDMTSYGPALDAVMRQLGLGTVDTAFNPVIPTGQESDAILLTRYFTLQWILQALAMQVDSTTADQKEAQSQRFKQVASLLASALAQVPSQYAVEGGDFAFGRLQLDILEPSAYLAGGPPFPYW